MDEVREAVDVIHVDAGAPAELEEAFIYLMTSAVDNFAGDIGGEAA